MFLHRERERERERGREREREKEREGEREGERERDRDRDKERRGSIFRHSVKWHQLWHPFLLHSDCANVTLNTNRRATLCPGFCPIIC